MSEVEDNPEKRTPQQDFGPAISEDEKNGVSYNIIITRYIGEKVNDTVEIDRYGVLSEAWHDVEDMITKKGWNWDG